MKNQKNLDHLDIQARVSPIENGGKTKALAEIVINGQFSINGLKVVEGSKGLFVQTPSYKDRNDEYHNLIFPNSKEAHAKLNEVVLAAYNNKQNKLPENIVPKPLSVKATAAKNESQANVKSDCKVTVGGAFVVTSVRVYDGSLRDKPDFVGMPGHKNKDGEYKEYAKPITKDFREKLNAVCIQQSERAQVYGHNKANREEFYQQNDILFEKLKLNGATSYVIRECETQLRNLLDGGATKEQIDEFRTESLQALLADERVRTSLIKDEQSLEKLKLNGATEEIIEGCRTHLGNFRYEGTTEEEIDEFRTGLLQSYEEYRMSFPDGELSKEFIGKLTEATGNLICDREEFLSIDMAWSDEKGEDYEPPYYLLENIQDRMHTKIQELQAKTQGELTSVTDIFEKLKLNGPTRYVIEDCQMLLENLMQEGTTTKQLDEFRIGLLQSYEEYRMSFPDDGMSFPDDDNKIQELQTKILGLIDEELQTKIQNDIFIDKLKLNGATGEEIEQCFVYLEELRSEGATEKEFNEFRISFLQSLEKVNEKLPEEQELPGLEADNKGLLEEFPEELSEELPEALPNELEEEYELPSRGR